MKLSLFLMALLIVSSCAHQKNLASRVPSSERKCFAYSERDLCIGDMIWDHHDFQKNQENYRGTPIKEIVVNGDDTLVRTSGGIQSAERREIYLFDEQFSVTLSNNQSAKVGLEYQNYIGGRDSIVGYKIINSKIFFLVVDYPKNKNKQYFFHMLNEQDIARRMDSEGRYLPPVVEKVYSIRLEHQSNKALSEKHFRQMLEEKRDEIEARVRKSNLGSDYCKDKSKEMGLSLLITASTLNSEVDFSSCVLEEFFKPSRVVAPYKIQKIPGQQNFSCKVKVEFQCEFFY